MSGKCTVSLQKNQSIPPQTRPLLKLCISLDATNFDGRALPEGTLAVLLTIFSDLDVDSSTVSDRLREFVTSTILIEHIKQKKQCKMI